ncbi:alpha/beta fold hydrolase [Streptomyces albiaxialis]|uniref:Alpha/beta fold hydrolase n=1 Tax=Streptomyces albiaxialis TaxID=329523 RepID=A0ABP5HHX6_9ACTN
MPSSLSVRSGAALAVALVLAATAATGCGGGDDGGGRSEATGSADASSSGSPSDTGDPSGRPDRDTGTGAGEDDGDTDGPTRRRTADLPDSLTRQKLDWSRCPAPDSAQGDQGGSPSPMPDGTVWECATLKAPVDYSKPNGRTLGIEMIRAQRHEGKKKSRRIGSLVFNFGGPGGSGVAALPSFGQDYTALQRGYDLVSFDPRGVGRSEGVRCASGKRMDAYFAADWTPDTDGEEKRLFRRQDRFAKACGEKAGTLLRHLTTANTARDMDLMREVLGDRKLHYFGISYGTELGGVYAHLFPEKVGRAVFDAVVDPTATPQQGALSQAAGFQLALDNYLSQCAEQGPDCPVGDDPEEAKRRITDLLAQLDAEPLPTDGPRKLTESLAEGGIAQALYSEEMWDLLSQGLDEALHDDNGSTLLLLSDSLNGRNQDGSYSTLQASLTAISCADAKERYSADDIKAGLPSFAEASGVFGPMSAWGMAQCHGWPVKGRWKTPSVNAKGSAPILLVGTTGDPATPYAGTRHMKERLGPGVGVELTYRGEGHGAYDSKDKCVRANVNGYLLKGRVPADGTSCG